MPFTPSHAVVALPFLRTPLVPAAIAVGAMTPDLPLFVRGTFVSYEWTHSFAWVGATGMLALALLLVWRCLLRPGVRELAPRWLAARLPGQWDAGAAASAVETVAPAAWRGTRRETLFPLALAISLLLGVVTHIAWDLFTHEGRWGVAALPVLDEQWGPLTGYTWLQHGSSALGLMILGVWAGGWLRRRPAVFVVRVVPAWVRWAWWMSLPAVLVAALGGGLALLGPLRPGFGVEHLAYLVLPPACAVWGLLTLALCVAVQLLRHAATRPG
ncbi:MAG: DUF4184 family protein [Microbacterium sp.]